MCGRYRLSRDGKQVVEDFAVEGEVEWSPRYNIAPTDPVLTVRQDPKNPVRHCTLMRWGLIPFWARDRSIALKTINGMSETAAGKPAFRQAMQTQRCLIPADGFYEWLRTGPKEKQPYNFGMADDSLFAFAGLWDRWKDRADDRGNPILSCTILTTRPNTLVAEVHNRMPAILRRQDYDLWLDPGITDPAKVVDLLAPFDPRQMKKYPVSKRVNSVKNDDPQCAQEIQLAAVETQEGLFPG
ncbi:MAG TPA: SOS response-associated peptidase [Candidatus Angelobacter sp.]